MRNGSRAKRFSDIERNMDMKKTVFYLAALVLAGACAPKYNEGAFSYDGDDGQYAAVLTSRLDIENTGTYDFYVADGWPEIYLDGELLFSESPEGADFRELKLTAGRHEIRAGYSEYSEGRKPGLWICPKGETVHEYGTNERPEEGIPPFVMEQAEETYGRYLEWKGGDETVVFPILTDIHTNQSCTYQHIGFIAKTDELFHYDFLACLGDIGLNIGPGHLDREYADNVIALTAGELSKFGGVVLYSAGNHDWDAGEDEANSQERLSDVFQKPALAYGGENLHLTPGKVYCYYDIPGKNVRVIVLNSEGTGALNGKYYYFDDVQVEWLKGLLDRTDPSTSVIVFSHYMPHPNGRWHNEPAPYTKESNERLMNVLESYKEKRNIAGLFCGDSHFNMHEVENGVNYFVTQSYGYCSEEQLMPGTRRAFFNYRETLCCDIVALKPEKGLIHTFRMGAGGADFDCEFPY